MRIGSLCSGYGGLDLAAEHVFGATTVWHAEYEAAPSAILAAHWDVPNHHDITAIDWQAVEPVDIITAGYPCQPFSHAGKRKGTADERHLWPYIGHGETSAIGVLRPRYIVLENVRGHLSMGATDVIGDLAALGYDATWGLVRASDAGAPHGRARLFIVATDSEDYGRQRPQRGRYAPTRTRAALTSVATPDAAGDRRDARGSESAGQPRRLDDGERGGTTPDANSTGLQRRPSDARQARTRIGGHTQSGIDFGPYAAAIRRWEHVTGRVTPEPTESGNNDKRRLAPRFVEWLMGLEPGWVTDVDISRNAQLKALGNGVVPQQAILALETLLPLAMIA